MLGPKFVQGIAFQGPAAHYALRFQSIDNFPRLADSYFVRQLSRELRFEPAAAPHSFHENRLEGEGSHDYGLGHSAENVQRSTPNVQRSIQKVVEVLVPSTCSFSFGG